VKCGLKIAPTPLIGQSIERHAVLLASPGLEVPYVEEIELLILLRYVILVSDTAIYESPSRNQRNYM
jgi:hypothetical protein